MATYKLIGQRFLRKYTASRATPVYAASSDAQLIVSSLCDVAWSKALARDATMTYHSEENLGTEDEPVSALDMNVKIRDEFDAALFCAEHESDRHRAYANAAVYRYELPDEAVGVSLSSLKLAVTSDPYNSAGARIHVMTNSTGTIPTNCHTCRGEDSSGEIVDDGTTASAVAPRTSTTSGGKTYWYAANATCTLSPTGGLTLQKYLFVFVLLESYSTVRGNWLEGCSYIRNLAEITTADSISGWTDGDTVDLSDVSDVSFPILRNGVLPTVPKGAQTGERTVIVRSDADLPVNSDNTEGGEVVSASGMSAASALGRLFSEFFTGGGDMPTAESPVRAAGAFFNVIRVSEEHLVPGETRPTATDVLKIVSRALVIPFSRPHGFVAGHVKLEFDALSMTSGARFNVFISDKYLTSLEADVLKDPGLYDLSEPPLTLLGTIDSGTSATFSLPSSSSRVGTVVVTAYFPPENFNLTTGGTQGTGATAFLPDVTVTD